MKPLHVPAALAALPTSECVLWTGPMTHEGYGKGKFGCLNTTAHRIVYLASGLEIPPGYVLDHLCRNRACVNPQHLEPVSTLENVRRSEPATKTACVNGHPYDAANTYIRPSGQRDCRACIRVRARRYKSRVRQTAAS